MESAVYLGQLLHLSGSMDIDIRTKRAKYIDETVEVRETYGFASPCEVLQAVTLYVGSQYAE